VCSFADEHPQNKTADAFCGGILLKVARGGGDVSRRPEILRRLQHAAPYVPSSDELMVSAMVSLRKERAALFIFPTLRR
jgi:hypothetical protein